MTNPPDIDVLWERVRLKFGNPMLQDKGFGSTSHAGESMTLDGVVNKSALLYLMALASTATAWANLANARPPGVAWLVFGLGFAGAVAVAWSIYRKQHATPYLASAFAILEGVAIGAVAAAGDAGQGQHSEIFIQVVGLTFNTLLVMLLASMAGLLRRGVNFKIGVGCVLGAVGLQYFIDLALLRAGGPVYFIHDAPVMGIFIGAMVVAWAAMNLVFDFRSVQAAVKKGLPKHLEWRAAFALVLGLSWLYVQLLWIFPVIWPSRRLEPVRQVGRKPGWWYRRLLGVSAREEKRLWQMPGWLWAGLMTVFVSLAIGLLGLLIIASLPWIFEKLNPYLS